MPENSEAKSPERLLIENFAGMFIIATAIAFVFDDPQHEFLFAALKYTAVIYLISWSWQILWSLLACLKRLFYSPRAIFHWLYLRGLFEMYLRRVKNFFAR